MMHEYSGLLVMVCVRFAFRRPSQASDVKPVLNGKFAHMNVA